MELKRINLHRISEILSEKELKDVLGGSGVEWAPGTCGWSDGDGMYTCRASKEYVLYLYNTFGGHWCCDSCSTASYCNGGK